MTYEAARIAEFFDAYGEQEWTLFAAEPAEPELQELLARVELELGAEPGAISCGHHILAVVRKAP